MLDCDGKEVHEHYSLDTQTFIEHQHDHDIRDDQFNRFHHHPPVDHHIYTPKELHNKERDTGRKAFVSR